MPTQSPTSKLSSLYKFLWGIPIKGKLLELAVASSIAAALALAWTTGLTPYSALTAAGFAAAALLNNLPDLLDIDLGTLNARRLNQLTIVNSIFLASAAAALYASSDIPVFAAIIAASTFLRVIIYLALAGERLKAAAPFLIISMIAELASAAAFLSKITYGLAMSAAYLVGCSAALLLALLLDKVLSINGVSSFRLISASLALLLDERREWLESIAEKLDDERAIRVDLIALREKGGERPELVIIVPTFHPGPFRSFGSSRLMYQIAEKLRSKGVEAVFFKGLSNHETNIVSPDDCARILEGVSSATADDGSLEYHGLMSEPVFLQNGEAKSMLISIGNAKLIFLTMHPRGMEDIPPTLGDGLNDIIPVDCHNSFSDSVKELDEKSLSDIASMLREAMKISPPQSSPIMLGYARGYLEGRSLEDGLGGLGISAIVLKTKHNSIALVALDGNNCLPEVRSKIAEELGRLGLNAVEVMTTDTHVVNGLRFGGRGYHPLGEVISAEELAEKAREVSEEALNSLKPVEAAWRRLRFEGVKVTSSKFFQTAASRTSQGIKAFLGLLIASAVLGALLSLVVI